MRISVAVPSLDYAAYLEQCLSSLRTQTHADIEVLIADGGSIDGSLDIIADATANDARFRLVSRADAGQADAVQKAFEQSTGAVFGFLNADDCYLGTDALELVARAFADQPAADLVSFGGWYIDEHGHPIRRVRLRYHPFDGTHLMRYRTAVLQPATFWRRHVQQAIPLAVDYQFAFDAVFFYQAYCRFRWLERPEAIAGYRLHGRNKSRGIRAERVEELARFEALKFGADSARAAYLRRVATVLRGTGRVGRAAPLLKRGVYGAVNALSYVSVYRVPGI